MVPNITPIMENQMEKKMDNEMETGIIMPKYSTHYSSFHFLFHYPNITPNEYYNVFFQYGACRRNLKGSQVLLPSFRYNGKENGNYYLGFRI